MASNMFFLKMGGIWPDVFWHCHRQRDGLFRWNGRVQLSWWFQTSLIFSGFGQFWKLKNLPAPSKSTVGNPFHECRSRRNPFAQKLNNTVKHTCFYCRCRNIDIDTTCFLGYKATAKTTTLLFWKSRKERNFGRGCLVHVSVDMMGNPTCRMLFLQILFVGIGSCCRFKIELMAPPWN